MLLALAGCGDPVADNKAAVGDVRDGRSAEVTVEGPVVRTLADGHGARGPHQRFDVDIGSGVVVEVDHNLGLAARVPLHVGDVVTVHGQLEPDPGRPVIHDTHRSTGGHESGWIDLRGDRYQ